MTKELALTPEEIGQEESLFADRVKLFHESSETSIPATLDWESLKGVDIGSHSVAGFCIPPLQSIGSMCEFSDAKKASVQQKIKKIGCAYDPEIPQELTLSNGTLTWKYNWDAVNVNDYIVEFNKKTF
jgi:hypothetical protein